jgi:hypothetical protein
MGTNVRSIVGQAAKLAVYEDIIINTKNHHTVPITRQNNDLQKYQYFIHSRTRGV